MMAQHALQLESVKSARNLVELLLLKGESPNLIAAHYKSGGVWKQATWGELLQRIRRLSEALVDLGISPGDRVAIFAPTRLEWSLSHFAIMGAGAIAVPIYASNTAAEVEFILRDAGVRAVVLDGDAPEGRQPGRWTRLQQVRGRVDTVEHVIAFDLPSDPGEGRIALSELEARGAELVESNPRGLEERSAGMGIDDLSVIVYTSGTTGNPKGVMLTHGNWSYQARMVATLNLMTPSDVVLLFLPLAHSFALSVQFAWLAQPFQMAFAESVERLVDNAAEVRATVLPAVPRIFEKAYARVVGEGASAPGVKGVLFRRAMAEFEKYVAAREAGREYHSLQWALAKRLVFARIAEKLNARFGGRMRLFISGSAPLSRKIHYFFDLCGFTILEGYGLTETAAPTHVNRPGRMRIGTVGPALPETEVRLASDNEILVRGPQVMRGYFKRDEETRAALDPDGWFHTGDIGEIDSDGFLRITDRKKDLIKTSGGKYIAPQELENALKAAEPLIGCAMVHGDRRKYISLLVTISEESARKWAKEAGISYDSFAALTQRPEIRARVQAAVDAVNAVQPSYATIKRFAILDHEWSQETGELTPTLKVRRKFVNEKYKRVLDRLYDGETFD